MDLEFEVLKTIEDLKNGKVDQRVIKYQDHKNKYMFLKPRVYVVAECTDGTEAEIDVTDFFKGDIK